MSGQMADVVPPIVDFNRCGEWVSHYPAGSQRGWRHTDDEKCPVCRGEVQSAPNPPDLEASDG